MKELSLKILKIIIILIIYVIFIIGVSIIKDTIGIVHIVLFLILSIVNFILTTFIKQENNTYLCSIKLIVLISLVLLVTLMFSLVPDKLIYFIPMIVYLIFQIIFTLSLLIPLQKNYSKISYIN